MSRTFEEMIAPAPEPTRTLARRLRELVLATLDDVDEAIVGGAKVGLALYSRGGPTKVLCGVQPSGDSCLLYVHHLRQLDHPRLTLAGKGKRARHVRFQSLSEILPDDIEWLLREVERNAPAD